MTQIKRVKPAKVAILHSCTEKEKLERLIETVNTLSIILTGNSHPETGLCRHVAILTERQTGIKDKLDEIHISLETYHSEAKFNKEKAIEVERVIEKFMAETKGVEKGVDKISTQKQVNFNNIISIVGTVLVVIGLVISVLIGKEERNKIETRIDNLGTPVIVNSRGDIVSLPAGDSLKFFRDGEYKTGIKDTNGTNPH